MAARVVRKCYRRSSSAPHLELHPESISITHPSQVLIEVHAVSVNFRDPNILHGNNPWPVIPNGIPCSDAAGKVIEVGSEVKNLKVGDRVSPILDLASITGREQERCWLAADVDGVLADHLVFNEEHVMRIPEYMGWKEASLLPCTGGVSLMAVKLARAAGCRVILSSSSDQKLDKIKTQNSHPPLLTINYASNPAWHEEVLSLTDGKGVDIVLENGGTSSLVRSLQSTRRGGTVSQVGYLGKQNPDDLRELLPRLIDRRTNLRGINVGSKQDFEDLVSAISATRLDFTDAIDAVFEFGRAEEAFEYVWKGKQIGKVVIEL